MSLELSPEKANEFLTGKLLFISQFTEINDEAATILSRGDKPKLIMNSITSLTDQSAQALSEYEGDLRLLGVQELSDTAAGHLAKLPNLTINLDNLPASAAQILRDAGHGAPKGVSDRTKVLVQVLLFLALVASVVFVIASPDVDLKFVQGLSSTIFVIVGIIFVVIVIHGNFFREWTKEELDHSLGNNTKSCRHCGEKVSVEAQTCVHCGCPNPSRPETWL